MIATLAELPEGVKPQTIMTKVAENEQQRDQIIASLSDLRAQRQATDAKVINTEQVFRVFRMFQKDFAGRLAHEQREILRSVVSRVIVQEKGVRVFYYGSPREDQLLDNSPEEIEQKLFGETSAEKNDSSEFRTMRSLVRPVSRMVGLRPCT